ncbi:MAG: VWA domain-containing protein [Clostridia bacterium]|nr:VWA domain-containing protein [Clostridia bacterium]
MKTGKRIISFLLCAVMVFGMFSGVDFGIESSIFDLEASAADITLGGITQKRVVSNYESLYAQYQARFFTGKNSNSPTNFVIPGLSSDNDYTPQGMTYWEEKEWILISAYDASGAGKHSVIYAIDAVSTEFVALFKILNANGSVNTSHGGGIAASKYNFYYADTGSNISYFPLSEMDVAKGTVKEVKLRGSINCGGELGGAATSYCCYEDGVLWAGNFYYSGDDRYKTSAHSTSDSMIVGYELHGNSSAEEWYYLSKGYNLVNLNNSTGEQTSGAMKYTTSYTGGKIMISGKITTDTALGEVTPSFASCNLTEGKKYIVEFTASNNLSDMYFFSPSGTHCNVKQSTQTKVTKLENGYYHYSMTFTAGLKPTGADSSWPTSQSTNGSYTGTYTMRFDQDSVPAGGREFIIKDFAVMEYDPAETFDADPLYEGAGCAGNPTHVITFPGMDKFQYAMVYKGRIYISRSWKRTSGTNHTRELMVGNLDTSSTGTNNLVINGRTRPCYTLKLDDMTRFGGDNGNSGLDRMLYMGEALCVMNDNLYMFGEGAAWAYNGKESDNKCPEPIDVIWKIDQHAIMEEQRPRNDIALSHYEKVWSINELSENDEYIIVYESELEDPVTQKNILYAVDAFGGYGAKKLPKQDDASQANSGDSMGIVGYPITTYSKSDDGEILYVEDSDDANRSIRWNLKASNISGSSANITISNTDLYYVKYKNLYFGSRLISMRTADKGKNLDKIKISTNGDGKFYLYYEGALNAETGEQPNYYLWCNDGSNSTYMDKYTNYYATHGKVGYTPSYHGLNETAGTFHSDGLYYKDDANSGNLMHSPVDTKYGAFHIYKRVTDVYADTYDSRVYTDLNAKLQPDGTYKIDLETYAIGSTQYKVLDKERPTDFIFVVDTSGSMSTQDCNGYHRHNSFDLEAAAGTQDAAGKTNDKENSTTTGTYTGNMWVQHEDGEICRVSVKVQGDGKYWKVGMWATKYYQRVYLWYTHPNGTKYWYHPNSNSWTTTETTYNEAQRIEGDSKDDRYNTNVFSGVCYEKRSDSSRLSNMQIALNQLTWKIQEKAQSTGLAHRIAVVQYGSNSSGSWTNTGMYTNSGTSRVGYTGTGTVSAANYQKAFHSVSQFGNVRNIIDNLSASGDTFVDAGMDMAYNIVANSDANYLAGGDRSACIIMITDGCPGFGGDDSSTANTVANAAIQNAYKAKDAGAYVYTVQMGNNSMSGFDMNTYMDNVSSEFIDAKSMSDSGERNVREIEYHIDVPIAGFNLDGLVTSIFNSVTSNSKNALAKLDASSLLHAEITEAFDLSNATVTAKLADAEYDGLDRLYFKDPVTTSGVTVNYNKTQQSVDVSGYNYSEYYVTKANADVNKAKKLVVTFEGVVPNVDMELNDANINDTETTAIYQKSGGMEFKKFPTEHFSMPEYTYVLDFDLPMLDKEVNGTLVSVDSLPRKQDINNYTELLYADDTDVIVGFANSNQDLVYSLRDGASNETDRSRAYVLIQREDETYDWFKLNILPASNVLYGDYDKFDETGHSSYPDAESWDMVGSKTDIYQSLTSTGDLYGFDDAYDVSGNVFSAGNAYEATVSDANPRTKTLKFDYTGDAVDVISACGPETGIQIVTIKNKSTGEIEKVYIIDTYYTDTSYLNNGLLCQVPVIHHENVNGYGEYSVEITGAYLASMVNARPMTMSLYSDDTINFYTPDTAYMAAEAVLSNVGMEELLDEDIEVLFADENSVFNGGTGATGSAVSTFALTRAISDRPLDALNNYFDGFRVYNPLGDMSGAYVESEQGASYYNIVNELASTNDIITGAESVVGYVEGGSYETINFADYSASKAPMNEIYLSKSYEGVTFNLVTSPETKVMISLRAINGATKAKVNNKEITVNSATEMYYDITDAIDVASGNLVVTVQNSGSGLLSVCNIKVVSGGMAPLMMSALPRVRMMMAAPVAEDVPEEPEVIPEVTPNPGGTGNDPDLDVEGEIPDYVPGMNDSSESAFEAFIDMLRTFIDRVIGFFKSLINLMGGK